MFLVDTDFQRNVKRVRPFLGVLLVMSVGLLMYSVVTKSVQNLTESLPSGSVLDVHGSIALNEKDDVYYGDLLRFGTSIAGDVSPDARGYVTVVCFQEDDLVYQYSAKRDVKFLLTDPLEPGLDWDGKDASCNASLIYRVPSGDQAELYMLDSVSFEVVTRG